MSAQEMPGQGGAYPTALFIDTNVWVDYFFDRSVSHAAAGRLVGLADVRDVALYTAITGVKDFYYLAKLELKRIARAEGRPVDEELAAAADEVAWACVRSIVTHATVVSAGVGDVYESFMTRVYHGDFEDDLVLSMAQRSRADYLVTSDVQLAKHASMPCLSIAEALALLEG